MMNKIAESHFNALRASSHTEVQPEGIQQETGTATHDALSKFLSTPSFSGKQIAIESLLRQITQGTTPGKISTLG